MLLIHALGCGKPTCIEPLLHFGFPRIPSMDCAACAVLIQKKICSQARILNATVTFQKKEAIVGYEPNQIIPAKIITAINEAGFNAEPTSQENIR